MSSHILENGMGVQLDKQTEEEYKKAGEYIMNSINYEQCKPILKEMSEDDQVLMLACESLKGGLDASELTDREIDILFKKFNNKWFDIFKISDSEINAINEKRKKFQNISENRRRFLELSGKAHKTNFENEELKKLKKLIRKEN